MKLDTIIPSTLHPIGNLEATPVNYPVQVDANGDYYIEIAVNPDVTQRIVVFYDENGDKINDLNYKIIGSTLTVYIGKPTYTKLAISVYRKGDQLNENRLELFCLDSILLDETTQTYRFAIGRKSSTTFNVTINEFVSYLEYIGVFNLFLSDSGNLENIQDKSKAIENLSSLSKKESDGKWDNVVITNQGNINQGPGNSDGYMYSAPIVGELNNDPSRHLYGLNTCIPDNRQGNKIAVGIDFVNKVFPNNKYVCALLPTDMNDDYYRSNVTPIVNDAYDTIIRTTTVSPRNSRQAYLDTNASTINRCILYKEYYSTAAQGVEDNRQNYILHLAVQHHFAVRYGVSTILFEFSDQEQYGRMPVDDPLCMFVNSYIDSLSSADYTYDSTYKIKTALYPRFKLLYKGQAYDNSYKYNEDSTGFSRNWYDPSYTVDGIREPKSIFDFTSVTPYVYGYNGDLVPPGTVEMGNNRDGWNVKWLNGAPAIFPSTDVKQINKSGAFLYKNTDNNKCGIACRMPSDFNASDNMTGGWGKNEWWLVGDCILPMS